MDYCQKTNSSHKKIVTDCPMCFKSTYSACQRCKGVCIFSKAFFKASLEDKALKSMVKSKFYNEDFNTLRQGLLNEDSSLEEVIDEQTNNYDLLKIYYDGNYDLLLSGHTYHFASGRQTDRSGLAVKIPKAKGRCFWHRSVNGGKNYGEFEKPTSRSFKKMDLVKKNEDFAVDK